MPVEQQSADVSLASTQFAAPIVPTTPVPGTLQPMPPMPGPLTQPTAASGSFPNFARVPSSQNMLDTVRVNDSTAVLETGRKKRMIVIIASAGLAAIVGVVLLIVLTRGGGEKKEPTANVVTPPPVTADAAAVAPPVVVDAAVVEIAVDAAVVEENPDKPKDDIVAVPEDPPAGECIVDIASTPPGAEIVQGKEVLGTTPAKLTLPCGVEAKLVLRKARFVSATRAVTPKAAGTKLRVPLGKNMLSVKVTSSPPGATITLGGKSLGVTPAMIKLPAMEASTLVISKPGFSADTQKFTPKQNNQSVHVALKKKGR